MHMNKQVIAPVLLSLFLVPGFLSAQGSNVLRFIPQIDLAFLDPHFTTAYVTRGHGHMVFDTLYGQDSSFKASPQMVEGHVVENDGRLWTLTLRPGLLWHDGESAQFATYASPPNPRREPGPMPRLARSATRPARSGAEPRQNDVSTRAW